MLRGLLLGPVGPGFRIKSCSEPVNLAEAGAVTLARLRIQFLLNNFINLNARTVFFKYLGITRQSQRRLNLNFAHGNNCILLIVLKTKTIMCQEPEPKPATGLQKIYEQMINLFIHFYNLEISWHFSHHFYIDHIKS